MTVSGAFFAWMTGRFGCVRGAPGRLAKLEHGLSHLRAALCTCDDSQHSPLCVPEVMYVPAMQSLDDRHEAWHKASVRVTSMVPPLSRYGAIATYRPAYVVTTVADAQSCVSSKQQPAQAVLGLTIVAGDKHVGATAGHTTPLHSRSGQVFCSWQLSFRAAHLQRLHQLLPAPSPCHPSATRTAPFIHPSWSEGGLCTFAPLLGVSDVGLGLGPQTFGAHTIPCCSSQRHMLHHCAPLPRPIQPYGTVSCPFLHTFGSAPHAILVHDR